MILLELFALLILSSADAAGPVDCKTVMVLDYGKKLFFDKRNAAFSAVAKSDVSDGLTVFAHGEISYLRVINNLFGRSFGTAVTNLQKDIFSKEIELLAKKYDLKILPYSDYNSMRFAFRAKNSTKLPASFEEDLAAAFERANKELIKYLVDNKLVDPNGKPPVDHWFHLGIGDTGPKAAGAVEKAKKLEGGPNRAVSYDESWVENSFREDLAVSAESLRKINNEPKFQGKGIIEHMPFTRSMRVTDEVLDYIKKSQSPADLKSTLNRVYGTKLEDRQIELLESYAKRSGSFTPPQLNLERTIANLDDAHHGGIAIDFRGLGAIGKSQTAQAITVAKDVAKARYLAALNEDSHTKWINIEKKRITKLFTNGLDKANIKYVEKITGDEMYYYGTDGPIPPEVSLQIAQRLVAQKNPSMVRMTSVPSGLPTGELRQAWVDFGEALEKDTRTAVVDHTTRLEMKNVFLFVEMHAQKPSLVIEGASPTLSAKIQDAYEKLLESRAVPTAKSAGEEAARDSGEDR